MISKVLIITDWKCHSSNTVTLAILEKLADHQPQLLVTGDPDPAWIATFSRTAARKIHILSVPADAVHGPAYALQIIHAYLKMHRFDMVFAPSTSWGRDLLPGLSSLFASSLASELIDFSLGEDGFVGTKLLYGGKCLVDVELLGDKPWFITVHSSVLHGKQTALREPAELNYHELSWNDPRLPVDHLIHSASERPTLQEADIIIAGGRGLRDKENMTLLEEFADALDAGVGASLGAVESGFAPRDILIGQSGSNVEPSLYIACGISGAMQHLAGLRSAKRILAINTDPDAPIMRIADFAIIGDLKKILPEMTDYVRQEGRLPRWDG